MVFGDKFLLELHPLIWRCLHKPWLPKKLIEFYHTQSGDLAKLPSECRLARSSGTNDDYALHTDQFSLEHGRHSVPQRVLTGCSFMALSFAEKVLKSKRPVVLFHTWTVTRELLWQAIHEKRSMDFDVCIDDQGHPYLGHPKEYPEKTHEAFFDSMPLWEAVEALADSNRPVIVDCKHFGVWPAVEDVVRQLRPERCLVHSFVSELKFEAGRMPGEPDFLSEWSSIERLRAMKRKFASVTMTASAKWLPADVLVSERTRPCSKISSRY